MRILKFSSQTSCWHIKQYSNQDTLSLITNYDPNQWKRALLVKILPIKYSLYQHFSSRKGEILQMQKKPSIYRTGRQEARNMRTMPWLFCYFNSYKTNQNTQLKWLWNTIKASTTWYFVLNVIPLFDLTWTVAHPYSYMVFSMNFSR